MFFIAMALKRYEINKPMIKTAIGRKIVLKIRILYVKWQCFTPKYNVEIRVPICEISITTMIVYGGSPNLNNNTPIGIMDTRMIEIAI